MHGLHPALTAVLGSALAFSNPPAALARSGNCLAILRNGLTYEQCGSVWYKPRYAGTAIQYVVVTPPLA